MTLLADGDQLDQLLINLVRNAVDASLETRRRRATRLDAAEWDAVAVGRGRRTGHRRTAANLFVPFFTTKPHGSGIGLVLSRQIAEAHGGNLTLENRRHRRGCIATLRIEAADDSA